MPVTFYMDVHVPQAITDQLRRRDVDVVTALEDGRTRAADDAILERAAALGRIAGLVGFRFVVSRVEHQDALRCEIVSETGADQAALATTVRDQIRAALRLTADVVCVATLPAGSSIVDERDWK